MDISENDFRTFCFALFFPFLTDCFNKAIKNELKLVFEQIFCS